MPRREALTRTEKDTMKLKLDENGHVVTYTVEEEKAEGMWW